MKIRTYTQKLVDLKGSDLHLKVGIKPVVRVNGELIYLEEDTITKDYMDELIAPLMNPKREKELKEELTTDFAYAVPGLARFRVNLSYQRGSYMMVMRLINNDSPDIDELNLPTSLKEIVDAKNGLILVTGATGSGKSTTVAAMINFINSHYTKNIITIEDPIEYLFKDQSCIVAQKEIGADVVSFKSALKYVLRQDPDVIFLGELRDQETMEAAIKASETGHLVISTLHTINAYQTISRIIDFFPEERHKQIRYQLSENIRGVISQRLVPTVDDKRRAANEVMINSPTIRELILTSEGTAEIPKYIADGKDSNGMQTFDQSLIGLFNEGAITYETALKFATVKKDIELMRRGVSFSSMADIFNEMVEEN
jgi:twitching motility protein PilT